MTIPRRISNSPAASPICFNVCWVIKIRAPYLRVSETKETKERKKRQKSKYEPIVRFAKCLRSRGEVDGVTQHRRRHTRLRPDIAHDHAACVDANT